MGQIQLGGLWGLFETRIGMCTADDGYYLLRDGDYLEPRYKDGTFSDLVGDGAAARESLRANLSEAGLNYKDPGALRFFLSDRGEEYKREGDLQAAYGAYATLFTIEDKWNIMNLRRFSNLFLLDKNFGDLEKVLRFIHAFAVRVNKDKLKSGERLDTESWGMNVAWGSSPFLDFSDYVPFRVLEAINGGYSFSTKEGIEECARGRGGLGKDGRSHWDDYRISDHDFVNFVFAFGG